MGRERFFKIALKLILIAMPISFVGCSQESLSNETGQLSTIVNQKISEANTNMHFQIKADDISIITWSNNDFTDILFHGMYSPKRDDKKINELVSVLNNYTKITKSTEDEIKSIGFKKYIPLTLILKNNKGYIHIWPLINEVRTVNTDQGQEITKLPYTDRYIVALENDGNLTNNITYYTIYSQIVPTYLLNQISIATPPGASNYFTVLKSENGGGKNENVLKDNVKIKDGDTITFSGIGCSEGDINVYITDGGVEKYQLLKISPFLGEWSIERTISNKMKDYQGKNFILKKKFYYLEVQMSNSYNFGAKIFDLS